MAALPRSTLRRGYGSAVTRRVAYPIRVPVEIYPKTGISRGAVSAHGIVRFRDRTIETGSADPPFSCMFGRTGGTDEDPEGGDEIVVLYNSLGLAKVMVAATALLLAVAGYDLFIGARGTERLVGLLGAAVTVLVVFVFLEDAWFRFSRDSRIVTWRRRWALRQRSGSLPFASIQSVRVERPIGDDGTPSRRITLRTTAGEEIPITVGYRPDADGTVLQIASRIRGLLGHDADATHMQNVRALIAGGRIIDAIRVLREEEGLSLLEAKRRVDDLTRSSS